MVYFEMTAPELDKTLKDIGKRLSKGDVTEAEIVKLYRRLCIPGEEIADFPARIALRSAQFGYFRWPWKIRNYYRGKRVLDVGCGQGTDGIGFVTLGATTYCGVDAGAKLDIDKVKNKNVPRVDGVTQRTGLGWTPNEIMAAFGGRISIVRGVTTDLLAEHARQPDSPKFGVVALHTVTEHLMDLKGVLSECRALMEDDGNLIFLHDNFYSWKGHHMIPKSVNDLDESNPEHMQYADWNHLIFDPPPGHYFTRALNKIRLDDLRAVTAQFFDIEIWDEIVNDFGRLTDEILARHPDYSRRDLSVSNVFCVARPKAG